MNKTNNKIRHKKRFLALLLSLVMVMPIFPVAVLSIDTAATSVNMVDGVDVSQALHFYIRHWHTKEDDGTTFQGDSTDQSIDRYFVVVEGYIVPTNENDRRNDEEYEDNYHFYLVYQSDEKDENGNIVNSAGELEEIRNSGYVKDSAYVDKIDHKTGAITLLAAPVEDNDNDDRDYVEQFSGFSVSAGHSAVNYTDDGTMTITYDEYVHLVKAHAFYIKESIKVMGTDIPKVFGAETADEMDLEVDTAYVYTYTSVGSCPDHRVGEPYLDENGDPKKGDVRDLGDETKITCTSGYTHDITLSKLYNTSEGLHTDKTAKVSGAGGRTFDLTLESWYTEKYPPQVGFVIDASFSMDTAMDDPTPIKLTNEQISDLKINKLTEDPNTNGGWNKYLLTDEVLDRILNPRYTDNNLLSVSGYNYYVVGSDGYVPLGYWEGVPQPSALFEFNKDGSSNDLLDANGQPRAWLFNSVTTNHAKKVNQVALDGAYKFDEQDIQNWPTDDLKFSTSNGFQIMTTKAGIELDVEPKSGSFTISFKMKLNATGNSADIAELLYIGPESGNSESGYFTLYRDSGSSSNRLKGNQQNGRSDDCINIDGVFNNTTAKIVTLVFENADADGGTVSVYIDGAEKGSGQLKKKLDGLSIVLAGIQDNYSGSEIYIDDFTLYDDALTKYQVSSLTGGTIPTIAKTKRGKVLGSINVESSDATAAAVYKHTAAGWYFITGAGNFSKHYELIGTSKRLLGLEGSRTPITVTAAAGYTYTSSDDTPVKFYVDDDGYLHCFYHDSGNNPVRDSRVYELGDTQYVRTEALQRAIGAFTTQLLESSPDSKISATRFSFNITAADTTSHNPKRTETEVRSMLKLLDWTDDPIRSTGMLSLNYGDGTATDKSSYEEYNYGLTGSTNTHLGLQSFIENLHNPRYNDPNDVVYKNASKYLILFTDGNTNSGTGAAEAQAKILKDADYTIFTVLLDGETMPNYGTAESFLTGLSGNKLAGTDPSDYFFSVRKGKAADAARPDDDKKYVGMNDTDILTDIFSEEILRKILVDKTEYTVQDYIDPRFDLTNLGVSTVVDVEKTDADGEKTTVKEIVSSEDTYTINLKSNGRIELVRSGGYGSYDVWVNLNDGRYVNLVHPIKDKDGKYLELKPVKDKDGKYYVLLNLSNADDGAEHPRLYWDNDNEMYYLKWTDQTIPGCAVGSTHLTVWNATVTIKAKEDFVGGNNVLTNGNNTKMNWVYDANDKNASSGTDDSVPAKDNASPSKGFPRVTVNVALLKLEIGTNENRVYLGEVINPTSEIYELGETVTGDHYWTDYLMRYAPTYIREHPDDYPGIDPDKLTQKQLMDEMLQALADNPSGWGLDIPYYYLPNDHKNPTNQPGLKSQQQRDQLGLLHYRWERLDPVSGKVIGVGGYTNSDGSDNGSEGEDGEVRSGPYKGLPYESLDTRRIEYRLVVSYWPFPDSEADFWKTAQEWEENKDGKYPEFTLDPGKSRQQTFLDKMWSLLEGTGSLSALIQGVTTQEGMGTEGTGGTGILGKYTEIMNTLVAAGFPESVTDVGTLNGLLDEIYAELHYSETTITIKLTVESDIEGELEEKTIEYTISGGLNGLLTTLDYVKAQTEKTVTVMDDYGEEVEINRDTLRVYIETELFKQRNNIANLISQAANYVDYLRWCYGYGEDADGNQTWLPNNTEFNSRKRENTKLLKYDTDYVELKKKAVGNAQDNKTAIGMSTVRVLRGELAFELNLRMYDLTLLFGTNENPDAKYDTRYGSWADKKSVPFYINLKREYEYPDDAKTSNASKYENEKWSPEIPDLKIDITLDDLEKLQSGTSDCDGEVETNEDGVTTLYYLDDNDTATNYPKAVYRPVNSRGGVVTYYSDPRVFDPIYDDYKENGDYARLLPIGTYSMTPSKKNKTLWSSFGVNMYYASDDNYAFDSWHFTRTPNEGEPNNSVDSIYFPRSGRSQQLGLGQLKAPETNRKNEEGELKDETLGVVFQLGTHTYGASDYYSGTNKDVPQYTDDRIGMARITATLIPQLPDTGIAEPDMNWYLPLGALLIALAGCLLFLLRRKSRV